MKTFEEYQFRFSIPHNKVKLGYKYSPNTKEKLMVAIKTEVELQGPEADLNCIDTSKITDMANLFDAAEHEYAKNFNGDISNWNVSNVKSMYYMFCNAESFDGDISNWNVSNVEDMISMFWHAKNFNGDISGWNVSNVEHMSYMFYGAVNFNQDISNWDISNAKHFRSMFNNCPIKEEYKPKFN